MYRPADVRQAIVGRDREQAELAAALAGARAGHGQAVLVLGEAGMDMSDVVKIITYLVDVADQPAYAKARDPYLGDARPAMTLLGVSQLAHPDLRIEVEVIAARKD